MSPNLFKMFDIITEIFLYNRILEFYIYIFQNFNQVKSIAKTSLPQDRNKSFHHTTICFNQSVEINHFAADTILSQCQYEYGFNVGTSFATQAQY